MECVKLAEYAVEKARKLGAYAAEAYVLDSKSLTIEVSDQTVETLKLAKDIGIGLRVLNKEGKMGFSYSSNTESDNIDLTVKNALANSGQTFDDPYRILPNQPSDLPHMKLLDEKLAVTKVEDKIELVKELENIARAADPRVGRTEKCVYEDAEYSVALANSNGLSTFYRAGYCGVYASVLAEQDGDVQSGMGLSFSRDFDKIDPRAVGREAAREATMLLNARKIGTTRASVVFGPYMAINLFSILIPALSADAVQKGRSLLKGKLGKAVASPLITLLDDGRLEGGIASSPVDGEGVPTRKNELIVEGVLRSFMYDTYTAKKENTVSTGNAVRGSFKSMPEIGPTNIFIKPGNSSAEKLISEISDGFYVTNIMGMHTANPISGDFSVGAAGVWIKNGELTHAVRGVAIAGNILEMLKEIDAVANDLRFFGSQGSPTIRIANIVVSGS